MTSAMSRLAPPTCSTYQSITVIDDLHQRSTQPSTRWLQPATRLKNHALASRRRSNQSIRMPTISAKSSPDRDQRTKAIAQTVQSESIPAGDYYPGSNAWQTVKQDEWQGEMEVQGEIPSWLVSAPSQSQTKYNWFRRQHILTSLSQGCLARPTRSHAISWISFRMELISETDQVTSKPAERNSLTFLTGLCRFTLYVSCLSISLRPSYSFHKYLTM